jgi:hypothetical protein
MDEIVPRAAEEARAPANRTSLSGLVQRFAALFAVLGFALLSAGGAGLVWWLQQVYATPTVAEYLAHAGPGAILVPAGALTFEGEKFTCGRYPTVLNPKLDDYGAAYFGFVLLNPLRYATLPQIVKRYAYGHECGHQHVGYDEGEADCYSIRRGKSEGWLDGKAMDAICDFISRSKGDAAHAFGLRRCAMMRRCFARSRPGREPL